MIRLRTIFSQTDTQIRCFQSCVLNQTIQFVVFIDEQGTSLDKLKTFNHSKKKKKNTKLQVNVGGL